MGTKLSVQTEEIPADRTFIVTGANTGIGYHTAKKIAELGGRVIVACRSEERAKNAIDKMQEEHKRAVRAKRKVEADEKAKTESTAAVSSKKEEVKEAEDQATKEVKEEDTGKEENKEETATNEEVEVDEEAGDKKEESKEDQKVTDEGETAAEEKKEPEPEEEILPLNIQFMLLDLLSLQSTMAFVKQYKDSGLPLHVLICNAGLFLPNKNITEDGFETQFEVNYLCHFLLTIHLVPLLKASGPNSRIVNVSSMLHKIGDSNVNLENIQAQNSYSGPKFYANSKIFQLMNMFTLSAKLKDTGINVFSVHPGSINSEFTRNYSGLYKVVDLVSHKALGRNTVDGSLTTLTAALDKQYNEKNAIYFTSCKPTQPSSAARNEVQQKVLWRYSLELLREHLDDSILAGIGENLENIQPKVEPKPSSEDDQKSDEKNDEANKDEANKDEANKDEKDEVCTDQVNTAVKKDEEVGEGDVGQEPVVAVPVTGETKEESIEGASDTAAADDGEAAKKEDE